MRAMRGNNPLFTPFLRLRAALAARGTSHAASTAALVGALGTAVFAPAASAAAVPDKRIPPSVMMEVKIIEGRFNAALADDCAPDKCYTKGCAYEDHITLDQARTSSLPGLPAGDEGPGNVVPQDHLTRVRCGFAHESTLEKADVRALARRLRKRLSHGWLTVGVTASSLDPVPKSLLDPEPAAEEEPAAEPEPEEPALPAEPDKLDGDTALYQLWNALLPHTPWMIAILLGTIALWALIWAARRLGALSLEERLLEAQLKDGAGDVAAPDADGAEDAAPVQNAEDDRFAAEQEALWQERLDRMDAEDQDVISRLLHEWLKAGEYATLARALFVFGDKVVHAFDATPDMALRKVEFATYFRDVDESTLPTRAAFFRDLNQQAMASLLLSQDDVHFYRALREDFDAAGVTSLARTLPARYGALLYALVDDGQQREVAVQFDAETRSAIARELLASNRMAPSESAYLSTCLDAVRAGHDVPKPPEKAASRHGAPVDSARALSNLLVHVGEDERVVLFTAAVQENGGSVPHWYEDIVFNHMLSRLAPETRNDVLLEVDIRGLSAWLQQQPAAWRKSLMAELSPTLQNALVQSRTKGSHAQIARVARNGQVGLATALKSLYAQGGTRFVDLVA